MRFETEKELRAQVQEARADAREAQRSLSRSRGYIEDQQALIDKQAAELAVRDDVVKSMSRTMEQLRRRIVDQPAIVGKQAQEIQDLGYLLEQTSAKLSATIDAHTRQRITIGDLLGRLQRVGADLKRTRDAYAELINRHAKKQEENLDYVLTLERDRDSLRLQLKIVKERIEKAVKALGAIGLEQFLKPLNILGTDFGRRPGFTQADALKVPTLSETFRRRYSGIYATPYETKGMDAEFGQEKKDR